MAVLTTMCLPSRRLGRKEYVHYFSDGTNPPFVPKVQNALRKLTNMDKERGFAIHLETLRLPS
eukprot:5229518-Amphidinium_carterae.1